MTYRIIEKQKAKKCDRIQARHLIGSLFIKSKSIDESTVDADIKNLPKFMVLALLLVFIGTLSCIKNNFKIET